MPQEIVAIVIVAIACGTAITILKTILAHHRETRESSAGESSLTTSQLEKIMERAARKALAPLEQRLASLEEKSSRPALPPKAERIELEEEVDDEGEDKEAESMVSRTSSPVKPAMEPRRTRTR